MMIIIVNFIEFSNNGFWELNYKYENKCFQFKKFLCTELKSVRKNNNSIDIVSVW